MNLEKAVIRAAAVTALAQFAFKVESLHESIVLLLQKCLNDSDDEVRERAMFYYTLLTQSESTEESEEIFRMDEQIDIEALEQYVLANREELLQENDHKFEIDVSNMRQQQQK